MLMVVCCSVEVTSLTFVKTESCLWLLAALILARCAASFCWVQKGLNPESLLEAIWGLQGLKGQNPIVFLADLLL